MPISFLFAFLCAYTITYALQSACFLCACWQKSIKVVPSVQDCMEQKLYLQKQSALLYYPRLLWSSIFCALFVKELVKHSRTLGKLANASSPSRDVLRGRREGEPQRGRMRGLGGSLKNMHHLWWIAETPLEQLIQVKQHFGF